MKSRRLILGLIVAAVVVTGFLGYTLGITASPDDWHNRGLYIDQLRPYWKHLFGGLIVLLMVVLITTAGNTDENDKGMRISD